jgi:hypothetical protein
LQQEHAKTHGFMDVVWQQRLGRHQLLQRKLRKEHAASTGFMHDVTNQRLAASQYYERRKYVMGTGNNTEAGVPDNYKAHAAALYMQRRAWWKYFTAGTAEIITELVPVTPLPDTRNSDSTRTTATPDEQVSVDEQLIHLFHPPHANREFWNGPPQQPSKKGYSFPGTDELISRAKQRIAREDQEAKAIADAVLTQDQGCFDAKCYKSWLRGHELLKESHFNRLLRTTVQSPVHFARYRGVWDTACKRKAQSDVDTVRLKWWLNAYQHRRHSTFSSVMRWAVIARLQPSSPAKIDVFSQCKNLMQNTWRAINRSDYGTLSHTVSQMTKGVLLPSTHVTNRDPRYGNGRVVSLEGHRMYLD